MSSPTGLGQETLKDKVCLTDFNYFSLINIMMSINREEIRWKLQLLLDSLSNTIEAHEGERKKVDDSYKKIEDTIKEVRNNLLAGIAFGIGTWLSLIAISYIPKEQAWYIIIGWW